MSFINFDPNAQSTLDDPFTHYDSLLEGCPIKHYEKDGETIYISAHLNDVKDGLRNYPVWTSRYGPGPKDLPVEDAGLNSDPPKHTEWRRVFSARLMSPAIDRYESIINQLGNKLIDEMLKTSSGDLHNDFVMPLVVQTMAMVVGLPPERYLMYKRCADEILIQTFNATTANAEVEILSKVGKIFSDIVDTRTQELADKGVNDPQPEHIGTLLPDDIISVLMTASRNGEKLSINEIITTSIGLFNGGGETTSSLILNCMRQLLDNPEQWQRLKQEPGLIVNTLEESLRHSPPGLAVYRKSQCPVTVHGEQIVEGTRMLFSFASANRDPGAFSDPTDFKMDRSSAELNKHISFGFGPHTCPGSGLARLEARVALKLMVERLPNLRRTGPGERVIPFMFWGLTSFPAAWD